MHRPMANLAASEPLNVLVIGAGIGGLTAALGLRRNGHNVTIFERSQFAAELGAAVILAPNATGILRRLEIYPEEHGAIPRQWHTEYMSTGQLLASLDLTKGAHLWQHPGLLCHRASIHKILRVAATSTDGIGPPVKLHLTSGVSDVDVNTNVVRLENGSTFTGDFVVGADGVKSIARAKVSSTKPFPSGKSAYRFMVERKKAIGTTLVADLQIRDGEFAIWYGRDRRIWVYTTQFNELLNFVCMHPDVSLLTSPSQDAFGEHDNSTSHKVNMMNMFDDFDPRLLALMDLAEPSSIKLWQLLDMDPLPTRLASNLCLLGDAALAFLPHIGQGAASAIEDASSLAAVFPPGTCRDDILERLQLYNECRNERPNRIHSQSRLLGQDLEAGNEDARVNRERLVKEFLPYIFGHDEHDHTTQKLRELMYRKLRPSWSMPLGFGPMPGPRQLFYERENIASAYSRLSIVFKTSRTLLENLLPNDSMNFEGLGSVAYASFSNVTWSRVSWLGGHSYDQFGFYIHNVHLTKKPEVLGSFLAVLFVSSPDALVYDREDLGIPKLFCDLQCEQEGNSYRLNASWRGIDFAEVTLLGVTEDAAGLNAKKVRNALFTHRYIPSLVDNDKADVNQIVCLPRGQFYQEGQETVMHASKANFKFTTHDRKTLPTLSHIVTRLAELPILEVTEASVMKGTGYPNYEGAYSV